MRLLNKVIKSYQYDGISAPQPLPLELVEDFPLPPDEMEPEEEREQSEQEENVPEEQNEELDGTDDREAENAAALAAERRADWEKEQRARKEQDESQRHTLMSRAFEKAKQIVDSAQAYSAQIAREAAEKSRKEYEQSRKRGYSDGFAKGETEGRQSGLEAGKREGVSEGRREAEAESRGKLAELTRMIETVEKAKSEVLQKFEDGLGELAFTMAKTILKRELALDAGALRSIVVSATDSYRNQEWLRIYVSEKDAGVLVKADGGIAKALQNVSENVKVIPSPGMEEGGCILEMPDQVIDAGVDTQLRKMKAAIETAEREDRE